MGIFIIIKCGPGMGWWQAGFERWIGYNIRKVGLCYWICGILWIRLWFGIVMGLVVFRTNICKLENPRDQSCNSSKLPSKGIF